MTDDEIDEIYGLVGSEVVLLPIRQGSKQPTTKGWQRTTLPKTKATDYRQRLRSAPAIGVLLGKPSGGLMTIDCDCPAFERELLELNPCLSGTLRTAGQRGGNLWLWHECERVRTKKLYADDQRSVGELRCEGGQTIIAGAHPDGGYYRYVHRVPPIKVRIEDLHWPDWLSPPPLHLSPASPPSPPSPPLYDSRLQTLGARLKEEDAAREALEADQELTRLYKKFVEKAVTPRQGRRNHDLVRMVTFLASAVAPELVVRLCDYFHRLNASVFVDHFDQHRKETETHLRQVLRSWEQGLSSAEQAFLRGLPDAYAAGFRILRDLATQDSEGFPSGRFCMSEAEFGRRLGIHAKQAGRMLASWKRSTLPLYPGGAGSR